MEMVEVDVKILLETKEALLVFDGDNEVWLPKSQIEYDFFEKGKEITIEIPEWIAIEKGLV